MLNMTIQIESNGPQLDDQLISPSRNKLVSELMQSVLERVIAYQPVETGRTRNVWRALASSVASLRESGLVSVTDGEVVTSLQRTSTQIDVTNGVEYLPFVEYGTSQQQPVAMVRQALMETRGER